MVVSEDGRLRPRVLRLCSVFEPPPSSLSGRGVRFDPIGGMQNHTAHLTRALAALGVEQEVLTHRPPGAARVEVLCAGAIVRRFGLPIPWCRQLYSAPAAVAALRLARRLI
jgi:glycogen synthase